jgi:hypothetical protein
MPHNDIVSKAKTTETVQKCIFEFYEKALQV